MPNGIKEFDVNVSMINATTKDDAIRDFKVHPNRKERIVSEVKQASIKILPYMDISERE